MRIITGFHAIEEELRAIENKTDTKKAETAHSSKADGIKLLFAKPGPRVKKILASAKILGIPATEVDFNSIDKMVLTLPPVARDHRGIVLVMEHEEQASPLRIDECIKELATQDKALVLILDSITDPQNTGAIIRSADQFGVDLVVLPEHRGATDFEVISRTSAGASSWVKIVLVPNLVRAVEQLKEAEFWVYGADAGGSPANKLDIPKKTALVMGSEGKGITRLLREKCDSIVSIPTKGKLDSLNVSVAAGILLYEIQRNEL
jgi:23S rRNA (guanosine2251-2'-O)-methyltransferase